MMAMSVEQHRQHGANFPMLEMASLTTMPRCFLGQLRDPLLSQDLKQELVALLPRLRRFARTLTRSVSEADDLVQDCLLYTSDAADE